MSGAAPIPPTAVLARAAPSTAQAQDPDALYAQREQLPSAQAAEAIWAARLARDPKDFESAWKLARARYWLGGHAAEKDRKPTFEAGIAAGRTAVRSPRTNRRGTSGSRPTWAPSPKPGGMSQGLKYRGEIRNELETVLRLDAAFQEGSADRALGRWYFKVPGLFGGSKKKSEEHLRQSLSYNPNSTASLFFLAETLIDENRKQEARTLLDKVLAVPVDPQWAPEDREFKQKAQQLLKTL